jgi:hypothetical protein
MIPTSQTSQPQKNNLGTRYYNTLHGFQYLGGDSDDGTRGYVVGMYGQGVRRSFCVNDYDHSADLSDDDLQTELLARLRFRSPGCRELTSKDVWLSNFIGREYAAVRDVRDAPDVINALLSMGVRITLWTRLQPYYEPCDAPFSIEKSEHFALKNIKELLTQMPKMIHTSGLWYPFLTLDERLWKTEEGKQFAREMLKTYPELRTKHEIGEPLYLPKTTRPDDPRIDWPLTP